MTGLAIALAGALGSLCRWGVGHVLSNAGGNPRWPWGTLAVNVAGSFLIGAVMALFAARGELDSRLRMAITIGFLGGFTTYSSFAYETVTLLDEGAPGLAALYVGTTLVAAGAACAVGIIAIRALA